MGIIKLYEDIEYKGFNSFEKKRLPISFVKDFLFFFNISLEDMPKLIQFSEQLEKDKQFVAQHKKQFNSLTDREKEVFILVVNGKKTNEIAKQLYVETATISTHRKNIKQKLNLDSIFDWYKYARSFKLIDF